MSLFTTYLELGYQHIAGLDGLDHILFLLVLASPYTIQRWKLLLLMVTAFTIGHSLSLALAATDAVEVNRMWIEFLIPLTIVLAGLFNLLRKSKSNKTPWLSLLVVIAFGLIHGVGFSSFFQSLLGKEESILMPLLAFNLGIELGQTLIVMIAVILLTAVQGSGTKHLEKLVFFINSAVIGIASYMSFLNHPWS
jgi:hypothetical protein